MLKLNNIIFIINTLTELSNQRLSVLMKQLN